jgi:hypothetical protein
VLSVNVGRPATPKIAAIKCVVLDFPFVPVTPNVKKSFAQANGAGVGRSRAALAVSRSSASNRSISSRVGGSSECTIAPQPNMGCQNATREKFIATWSAEPLLELLR